MRTGWGLKRLLKRVFTDLGPLTQVWAILTPELSTLTLGCLATKLPWPLEASLPSFSTAIQTRLAYVLNRNWLMLPRSARTQAYTDGHHYLQIQSQASARARTHTHTHTVFEYCMYAQYRTCSLYWFSVVCIVIQRHELIFLCIHGGYTARYKRVSIITHTHTHTHTQERARINKRMKLTHKKQLGGGGGGSTTDRGWKRTLREQHWNTYTFWNEQQSDMNDKVKQYCSPFVLTDNSMNSDGKLCS